VRVLVVIPTYNEAPNIIGVLGAVRAAFPGDIAVIDDASDDGTGILARQAGVIVLRHACNLGIGASVQTGFLYALQHGYDAVVRVDGDLQHDPAYIPALISELESDGADIVVGSRFLARKGYQSTFVRRTGILILGILGALVGTRVTDPTSGYWAVNRGALEVLARYQPDDYPETQSLLLATRAGCRVRELPVIMLARGAGRSSIGVLQSGFYMLKVILAVLIERLRPATRSNRFTGR
jgi:glycosyltransferase involved in cell wall biosynthesis